MTRHLPRPAVDLDAVRERHRIAIDNRTPAALWLRCGSCVASWPSTARLPPRHLNARNWPPCPGGTTGEPPTRSGAVAATGSGRGGDPLVVLTVSAAAVLAVLVFGLCRYAGLRAWHAGVCVLCGFYLAASPLAPAIADAGRTLARLLTGH